MIVLSDELILKKIEAKNLSPFTQYYYQFNVCGSSNKSPLGSKFLCTNCV
jgi:phosphodiesterase/alkaline phosphatase D-like protein